MEHDLITGVRFLGAASLMVVAVIMALANRGKVYSAVYERSRWLVVAGCLLLGAHNLIQFFGHYREQSACTAWVVNLLFYVSAIPAYNLAERNLLRAGRNMRRPCLWAAAVMAVSYALLAVGVATHSLIDDARPWHTLTCAAALCLFVGTAGMAVGLRRDMAVADSCLTDGELHSRHEALRYTAHSMKCILYLSLLTPLIGASASLALHGAVGFVMFALLLWFAVQFLLFGRDMAGVIDVADEIYVSEAAEEETAATDGHAPAAATDVTARVEQCVEARHYADPSLTIAEALRQMNVSATALALYLEQHGESGYRKWISHLRISEAKRIMLAHPEYSLQAVAEECGYMHQPTLTRAFKTQTGLSPKEWQAAVRQ